mgnify:CR=1 FL=1
MAAAKDVARALTGYAVIVTKPTVPIGTDRKVADVILQTCLAVAFDVGSNPKFLREGAAIDGFMKPDRLMVGVESELGK